MLKNTLLSLLFFSSLVPPINCIENASNKELIKACNNNHFQKVKELLDNGADVNALDEGGYALLHNSAHKGYIDIVKLLIERNADVSARNSRGWTPLHYAALQGNLAIINLLLENEAEVDAANNAYWSSLHIAAYRGFDEVAKVLIHKKADLNARDSDGQTPLHFAAFYNQVVVVRLLIDHGADIHARDHNNQTPLHSARSIDVRRVLLDKKADGQAKDKHDCTPMHQAVEQNDVMYIRLLLSRFKIPHTHMMFNLCFDATKQPRNLRSIILMHFLNRLDNFKALPEEVMQLLKIHPTNPWDLKSISLVKFFNGVEEYDQEGIKYIMQLIENHPTIFEDYKKLLPFINLNNKVLRRLLILIDNDGLSDFYDQESIKQIKHSISLQNNKGDAAIAMARVKGNAECLRILESVMKAENFDQLPQEIKELAVCLI